MANTLPPVAAHVLDGTRQEVAQALRCDASDVLGEYSLIRDLGAGSLDILDLMFRLEHQFGIEIRRGELFAEDILRDYSDAEDGLVDADGIVHLKAAQPFADRSAWERKPYAYAYNEYLTVEELARFVEQKIQAS